MKKDIEWLRNEVNELPIRFVGFSMLKQREEFTVSKDDVLELINQLDEPEVLSQEWIDENEVFIFDLDDGCEIRYVPSLKLRHLISPNGLIEAKIQELIEAYKQEDGRYSNPENYWIDGFIEDLKNLVEEEQKYFAKIKGHENIGSDDKYWNYCITDEGLDIGDNKVHADVLAEYVLSATKDEWANLGINEDNADFVKVEELEE